MLSQVFIQFSTSFSVVSGNLLFTPLKSNSMEKKQKPIAKKTYQLQHF